MSCYEWEKGDFVLPTKCYSKFRQDVIKAWNDWQLQLLEKAKIAVELLRKAKEPIHSAVEILISDYRFKNLQDCELWAIVQIIPHKEGKWFVPKKQDLKLLPISKGATGVTAFGNHRSTSVGDVVVDNKG